MVGHRVSVKLDWLRYQSGRSCQAPVASLINLWCPTDYARWGNLLLNARPNRRLKGMGHIFFQPQRCGIWRTQECLLPNGNYGLPQ